MCLDHMQRVHVFGGLYHYPKYGWNQCSTFWWYASFNISRVWLEGAYWWLWPLNTNTKVHHGDHEKAIKVAKAHHPKHTICGPNKERDTETDILTKIHTKMHFSCTGRFVADEMIQIMFCTGPLCVDVVIHMYIRWHPKQSKDTGEVGVQNLAFPLLTSELASKTAYSTKAHTWPRLSAA